MQEEVGRQVDTHGAVGHREVQQQPQLRMCTPPGGRPAALCEGQECDWGMPWMKLVDILVIFLCLFLPGTSKSTSKDNNKNGRAVLLH